MSDFNSEVNRIYGSNKIAAVVTDITTTPGELVPYSYIYDGAMGLHFLAAAPVGHTVWIPGHDQQYPLPGVVSQFLNTPEPGRGIDVTAITHPYSGDIKEQQLESYAKVIKDSFNLHREGVRFLAGHSYGATIIAALLEENMLDIPKDVNIALISPIFGKSLMGRMGWNPNGLIPTISGAAASLIANKSFVRSMFAWNIQRLI